MGTIADKLKWLKDTQTRFFMTAQDLGMDVPPETTFRQLQMMFANLKLKGIYQITSGVKLGYSSFLSLPKEMDVATNNVNSLFRNCVGNEVGHPKINHEEKIKYANSMFEGCTQLKSINMHLTPKTIDNFAYNCADLTKIEYMDFSEITSMKNAFTGCPKLSYFVIKNLGKSNSLATYDFSMIKKWGDGSEVDSLISLQKTLTDNLYDRKTAGLAEVTIKLSTEVQPRLTLDITAGIQNKGYKLEFV